MGQGKKEGKKAKGKSGKPRETARREEPETARAGEGDEPSTSQEARDALAEGSVEDDHQSKTFTDAQDKDIAAFFGQHPCFYDQTHPDYKNYTPSQRGNYHHSMFHNPIAAVNLFHVGKQYLTLCKAEAAVTRNLIGRKIISNVKHADARNSLPILDVIRSSHKRHSASEYCK